MISASSIPTPQPEPTVAPTVFFATDRPEADARVSVLLGTEGFTATPLTSLKLRDIERRVIQDVMARTQGNISHAARTLGLSRSALYRRLERHGL